MKGKWHTRKPTKALALQKAEVHMKVQPKAPEVLVRQEQVRHHEQALPRKLVRQLEVANNFTAKKRGT